MRKGGIFSAKSRDYTMQSQICKTSWRRRISVFREMSEKLQNPQQHIDRSSSLEPFLSVVRWKTPGPLWHCTGTNRRVTRWRNSTLQSFTKILFLMKNNGLKLILKYRKTAIFRVKKEIAPCTRPICNLSRRRWLAAFHEMSEGHENARQHIERVSSFGDFPVNRTT